MNNSPSNIASQIKQSLTMMQVAQQYGHTPNKSGFIKCPFHKEKTASLKIYPGNKGFNCYGCNENGSVIDFTMKLFNINFKQALVRLSNDFGLNVMQQKVDSKRLIELKKKQRDHQRFVEKMELINEYWGLEFKKYYRTLTENKPQEKFEELNDEFVEALTKLPELHELATEKR